MRFFKAALTVASLLCAAEATRTFQFTLSEGNASPDGFSRKYTLINGATPGPVIEVNQGDEVKVVVTNTAAENATIHFHGIEMIGTPWNDGVPGVSQRPIKKGETYTYRWTASQYGSYWYHSHYRGQIEDGLYGAIIIHPKSTVPKPFAGISSSASEISALVAAEKKRKPLLVADVTHLHSHDKWDATKLAEVEVYCYDSIVFNGKGNVECHDPAVVAASLSDAQKGLLALVPGSKFSDKSCIPPANLDAAYGNVGKPELMPPGIIDGCKPTTGTREVISAKKDQWIAIDVIGANNFVEAVFSIDQHDMWVYAVEGEYVTPHKVQAFELYNGSRVSIMVKPKASGAFKIRVVGHGPPQIITGHAVLSVDGVTNNNPSSTPFVTLTGSAVNANVKFLEYHEAVPHNVDVIPKKGDVFFLFNVRAEASWLWAMNETRLDPVSIDTANTPALFAPDRNEPKVDNPVFVTTQKNQWVDMVFVTPSGTPMPPHPIHKHGNKMYHIGSGTGAFTWKSVNDAIAARPEAFNLVNPPKLDAVITLGGAGWAAVRYQATDPGAWAIHCHIHNHVEGGMLALIQDGIDQWPTIPKEYWDALK